MKYDIKIPYSDIIKMDQELKELDNFFENYQTAYPFLKESCKKNFDQICKSGKFSNYEFFLLWFPDFYSNYKKTMDLILSNNEGHLPLTWKIYLGIMAASTMRNEYLLRTLEGEFLLNGGEEDWLILGLDGVPEKLKNLQIINNIIAHQPWKITEKDIESVCKTKNSSSCWNMEDLVQSILILTTFHRLATILECLKIDLKRNTEQKNNIEQKKYHESFNKTFISETTEEKESFEESSKDNINISKSIEYDSSFSFIMSEEGIKNKIINNLELMNQSSEFNISGDTRIKERKNSNDSFDKNPDKQIEIEYFHSNDIIFDYRKYISKFCTVYLDFDNHSENYKSYFVIFIILI